MPRLTSEGPIVFEVEEDRTSISVTSGTSELDIEFEPYESIIESESGVQLDLENALGLQTVIEDEFSVFGQRYFLIRAVEPASGTVGGLLPTADINLIVDESRKKFISNHELVLLILDPSRGAIVDWANGVYRSANELRFELPLVPIDPDIAADSREDFLAKSSIWDESSSLLFCLASFPVSLFEGKAEFQDLVKIGKISKFAVFGPSQSRGIAEWIDRTIKNKEELQRIDSYGKAQAIGDEELKRCSGKVLFLCHGTFSSTKTAFEGLLNDPQFLGSMRRSYSEQVLAWNHWTLSKTTNRNAHDFMARLKELSNVSLDVICHSRGAGVIRNLFEDPKLSNDLRARSIRVNIVVYVAGACLGSQLAMTKNVKRLFRRITLLSWLLGGFGTTVSPIIAAIKALAIGVQRFPGIQAMDPVGKQIRDLNSYGDTAADSYTYIRANYEAGLLPLKLAQQIFWDRPIFGGKANDLMVPYDGASRSNAYLKKSPVKRKNIWEYGSEQAGQSDVKHTNFFKTADTKDAIRKELGFL